MYAKVRIPHVTMQGNVFLYERRVPKRYEKAVGAKRIRQSLRTKDPEEARLRAEELDDAFEARWAALYEGKAAPDDTQRFEAALALVKQAGFKWCPAHQLLSRPAEIVARAMALPASPDKIEAQALMGTVKEPKSAPFRSFGILPRTNRTRTTA